MGSPILRKDTLQPVLTAAGCVLLIAGPVLCGIVTSRSGHNAKCLPALEAFLPIESHWTLAATLCVRNDVTGVLCAAGWGVPGPPLLPSGP